MEFPFVLLLSSSLSSDQDIFAAFILELDVSRSVYHLGIIKRRNLGAIISSKYVH